MIYNPGDFTFLDTVADQLPLKDMYDAITSTGLWAMIKGEPDNKAHKCVCLKQNKQVFNSFVCLADDCAPTWFYALHMYSVTAQGQQQAVGP